MVEFWNEGKATGSADGLARRYKGTSRVEGPLLSEIDGRVEQLKVGSQPGREALTHPLVSALLVDLAPSS